MAKDSKYEPELDVALWERELAGGPYLLRVMSYDGGPQKIAYGYRGAKRVFSQARLPVAHEDGPKKGRPNLELLAALVQAITELYTRAKESQE